MIFLWMYFCEAVVCLAWLMCANTRLLCNYISSSLMHTLRMRTIRCKRNNTTRCIRKSEQMNTHNQSSLSPNEERWSNTLFYECILSITRVWFQGTLVINLKQTKMKKSVIWEGFSALPKVLLILVHEQIPLDK